MINEPTDYFSIDGQLKRGRPAHLDVTLHSQFATGGVWLRGNLHCHAGGHTGTSEQSAAVCKWYREHGFDFVAVKHSLAEMGAEAAKDGFSPLLGDELQPGHTLAIGVSKELVLDLEGISGGMGERTGALVKAIQSQGGLAIVAHPFWTAWNWNDLSTIMRAGAVGFEVANGYWRRAANGRSDQIWGMLLNAGYRPAAVGGDDSHSLEDVVAGKSWTGVFAKERSSEAILEAIQARRTYASEGPEIYGIHIEPSGRVVVECSPCRACYFSTAGWPVKNDIVEDGVPATQRFELEFATSGYRVQKYLVIVLEDAEGNRAWTSAIDMQVSIT